MSESYYDKIYRLEYIIRYSNVPRVHDESVASHSFFVAAIVMKLVDTYSFDLGKALQIAISHDIPEYATNDLSHETKRMFPEINSILKKVEFEALKTMPLSVRDGCDLYYGDSVEASIVHLADAMQCNQYARHEISIGNLGYMVEVEQKSSVRVSKLKHSLQNYELTEVPF